MLLLALTTPTMSAASRAGAAGFEGAVAAMVRVKAGPGAPTLLAASVARRRRAYFPFARGVVGVAV